MFGPHGVDLAARDKRHIGHVPLAEELIGRVDGVGVPAQFMTWSAGISTVP